VFLPYNYTYLFSRCQPIAAFCFINYSLSYKPHKIAKKSAAKIKKIHKNKENDKKITLTIVYFVILR